MHRLYEAVEKIIEAGCKPESGTMDGAVVTSDFVKNYIAIESRRLLIVNSGSTDEMRKTKTGVVVIKSTNADKTVCRVVRFTPVSGNEDE